MPSARADIDVLIVENPAMRRLALTLLTAGCVLLPACSYKGNFYNSGGLGVSERNGKLYVDGVLVQHHREVVLSLDATEFELLRLTVPTGLIDIVGVPGDQAELIVDVYSALEGDGDVSVAEGKLSVRSTLDGKIVINGVRGKVPAGSSLEVDAGTGQVLIGGIAGAGSISIDTGTAPVRLVDITVQSIEIESGTGDIRLENSHSDLFDVDTGTGDVVAHGCRFGELRGDTGTGDFVLRDCQVETAHFNSGTGDLRLIDTNITHLKTSMGTGEVRSDSTRR